MAVYKLASQNTNNKAKGTTMSSLPNTYKYNNSITNNTVEDGTNNGGFIGGIGYALEKVGLGFISGVEGFVDYTVGGLAELFENDELSEEIFANDWVNYNHADEWYDPSDGWKFVGDIAGGIGTSLPSIAAAAGVTLLSGGVASPLAAKILVGGVSLTVAGLSAAGNATKEAYQETGMLGGTEFGYGALSGATEAGLEFISGGLMKGSGRIVGEFAEWAAKKGLKETTETVAKTVAKKSAKSIFKELGEDFISEAIEEGLSEAVSPLYKRFTYDPDAEFATAKEIGYAAIVGGLSGLVMSGTRAGVKTSSDYLSGKKVIDNGKADKLLSLAEEVSKTESEYETGFTSFADTKEIYTELKASLEKTGGEITTANQKIMLGKLAKTTTVSGFMPEIERSAERIVSNPEALAAQYSEYLSSASGESINLTAEQLTKGIDMSLATTDRRAFLKQLRTAISTNPALSSLAIADATSHIFMDINKFSDAALNGKHVITQKNLNNFREKASDNQKSALAEKLGIENLDAVNIDQFNAAVESFFNSEEGAEYRNNSKLVRQARNIPESKAKTKIPSSVRTQKNDIQRYKTDNVDIAVIKNGDKYILYDYESGNSTRKLSIGEIQNILTKIRKNTEVKNHSVDDIINLEYLNAKINEEIVELIDDVERGDFKDNDKVELKALPQNVLDKIKELTGVDVSGFKVVIEARQLGHILKDHGKDGKTDHSMQNVEDIAKMEFVMQNPDELSLAGKTQAYSYMRNGRNRTADTVLYEREIGDKSYYVVQTVADTNKKTLFIVSAFIGEKGYKKGTSQLIDAKSPNATSASGSVVIPNGSISQPAEKINSISKNNSAETSGQSDVSYALTKTKSETLKSEIIRLGTRGITLNAGGKKIKILTDEFTQNKNIFSEKGRKRGEVNARIKAIPHFADILRTSKYSGTDFEIHGLENAAKKGVKAIHTFTNTYGNYDVEILVRDKGSKQFLYEMKFIEKKKSSQQSMTDNSASTAPTGDVENTPIVPQPAAKINTSEKKSYTLPEIMKLAKEKVKVYEDMNESKKLMVRGVIREALANGFSESDAVLYARVAARSGVSIKFDKARCATGFVDEDGNVIFADGFYSRASNEIIVNPEGTRSTSKLLIHELTHAIYRTRTGALILEKGVKNLTEDQKKSIEEKYGAVIDGKAREDELNNEKNAHYAEDILGDDKLLEKLLEDKPTLMDKILNFFKGAESDYADDERLSKEARKLYRHYKKLFDKFAERNHDNNLLPDRGEAYARGDGNENFALSSADIEKRFADYDKPITEQDVKLLRSIGQKSINKFTSNEIELTQKWAYKFYKEFGVKSPFFRVWGGDWRAHQTKNFVRIVGEGNNNNYSAGKVLNRDIKMVISWGRDLKGETINHLAREKASQYAVYDIAEILENAIYFDTVVSMPTSKTKLINTAFMHSLYSLYRTKDGKIHLIKVYVEEALSNNEKEIFKRGYQLKDIEKVADLPNSVLTHEGGLTDGQSTTKYSISDLYRFVKQFDKDFTPAPEITAETAKYMLNDDGTPKVFYHVTNAKFTEFKPEEMSQREGSYFFAENREDAEAYGNNIYEVYLSGRNFANYDDQPIEFYHLKNKREQVDWLKARKYDGWYADMDSGGWGEVSVFYPEQIKSAKTNIGTFLSGEKNINYALPDNMDPSKVTVSKGTLIKQKANYESEKVFSKKDITETLGEIKAFAELRSKVRENIIDRLWQGYNSRVDEQGYEKYSLVMKDKLFDELYESSMTDEEVMSLKKQIKLTLDKIVENGKPSIKSRMKDTVMNEAKSEVTKDFKLFNQIGDKAKQMKDLKLGTFLNATQYKPDIFKGSVETLASVMYRGTMSVKKARNAVANLKEWYTKDNPMLMFESEQNPGLYVKGVAEMLEFLSQGIDNEVNGLFSENGFEKSEIRKKIINTISTAISNKGNIDEKYNQRKISNVPNKVSQMVSYASKNNIDISGKKIAINGDYIWHEYRRHSDIEIEKSRGQIPLTKETMQEAIESIYNPDVVETIFANADKSPSQQQTFAYAKKTNSGSYVVVEAVGGKKNPNIIPVMILEVSSKKWDAWIGSGKSIGEMLYDSDEKFKNALDIEFNKKNRVTAAQFASSEAIANTPHSPRYDNSISQPSTKVNKEISAFSRQELKILLDVMSYFVKFVENYNKVWKQGKWVDAKPEAERYIDIINKNNSRRLGAFLRLTGMKYVESYIETFGDPSSVVRRVDMYEDGFFTSMFEELRSAAVRSDVSELTVKTDYYAFLDSHKKYLENAAKETITWQGEEIPKLHAIGLAMTLKRAHAHAGILYNGIAYFDEKGKMRRVGGVLPDDQILNAKQLAEVADDQRKQIEGQFSEADKEYISILEKGYNGDVRQLKVDRDMERLGFTNATEGYYYPIRRANAGRGINIDRLAAEEMDRVSSASFNKDTVKGAKQELFIESADALYNRHVHTVCQYAHLSPALDTFNVLFNLDTSGNPNKPISVRTESINTWKNGEKYFRKLITDIQGISPRASEGKEMLSFIRSSYAKYQLGANPKVWATQFSSILASGSILDADSITRGMTISASDIDKYCPLAWLRNSDNTAVMAQGNLDKMKHRLDKVSSFLMTPIGKVDRFVVCRLFGACQAQVEKNGGGKVGTEKNKVAAGELLEKVILETQQNSIATERSAAMRSQSEIMRTFTMFSSDAMKVIGRVIDSFGEISALRARIKAETDTSVRSELKKRLKAASRKAKKSTAALALSSMFMAALAQLFRFIYDKEQEEDEIVETMVVDSIGNMFGGLPIIRDAISYLTDGYELENYTYSTLNDLLSASKNMLEIPGMIISGEASSQDIAKATKNLSFALGQITGLPVRNIYNVLYGLTKRFSPTTAYKIDNVFYEKNYKTDLYKAIEENDTQMVNMLMSMLYNERMGDTMSENVHNELYNLSMKGYKVMPKAVDSKITYNGEEIELSAEQQNALRQSYSSSQASLNKLFSNAKYKALSEEDKVQAIKYVYELHYDSAFEDVLGIDGGKSVLLNNVFSADILALYYILTKGLESDKDKDGKTISGTKKKKIVAAIKSLGLSSEEQMLLLCAKGYSINDSDVGTLSSQLAKKRLLRYILNLKNISKENKAKLAEMCGFTVKNGRIMQNSVA